MYSPLAWFLAERGMIGLLVLGAVIMFTIERVPDFDRRVPGLDHRGVSHSIVAILSIGYLVGVACWLFASGINTATGVGLDVATIGGYGIMMGQYAILSHLAGDVITPQGIKPLLPLTDWRIRIVLTKAENETANAFLYAVGMIAFAVAMVGSFAV
jgi:inner membrane protein